MCSCRQGTQNHAECLVARWPMLPTKYETVNSPWRFSAADGFCSGSFVSYTHRRRRTKVAYSSKRQPTALPSKPRCPISPPAEKVLLIWLYPAHHHQYLSYGLLMSFYFDLVGFEFGLKSRLSLSKFWGKKLDI